MLETSLNLAKKSRGFIDGLMAFLKQYAVLGLAIGVITAQASKDLVDAIVKGVFTPAIKLIAPGGWSNLTWTVKGATFDFSLVLNAGLTFVIVMAFLYFVIKFILKRDELLEKK